MSSTTVSAVPKYRHHKGTGQAFVQIQGRRHYLGKWDSPKSKERYAAFVAELAVRPIAAILPPRSPAVPGEGITVMELCDAYWTFAQRYYSKNGKPSGWLNHIRLMLRKLRETYGLTPAAEFGPLKLKTIRQTLIAAGHSRVYINKLVPIIPRMFKWAVAEELIPGGVYQALRTVEGLRKGRTEAHETKPVLPVTAEVVDATLPHLPAVVADMIRVQRLTGARPGEICQLRPVDLDRSGDVWEYRPESHKTEHHGRERIIYIGPQAQQVLLPYLRGRPRPIASPRPKASRIATRNNEPAASRAYSRANATAARSGRSGSPERPTPGTLISGRLHGRSSWPTRCGRRRPPTWGSTTPSCCPTGTPTSYATARPRRYGSSSAWRPPRSSLGTPRPT